MKLKEKAMIQALLVHFQQDSKILRFLAPGMQKEIQALAPPQHLNFATILSPTKWIDRVHYSWFYPFVSTLPLQSQSLFFPLFSPQQRNGLETMLKREIPFGRASPFITFYLAEYLRKRLQKEEVLPLDALPRSSLNPLIKVKWSALMEIINYLGLFDLACDFRQIVDKAVIKRIYKALPPQHTAFLQYASKQTMKWTSPKLNLHHWDGDVKKLQVLLHKRGIMRLTKGILEEHLSFRWHLIHRLDVGRAQVMMNSLKEPIDHALIPYFRAQILQIASKVVS